MPAYLFVAIDREDLATYAEYEKAGFASLGTYGVRPLAVSDEPAAIEGDVPGRRVILLEFEDRAALDRWYASPEYQDAVPLRHRSASTPVMVAFEGPP